MNSPFFVVHGHYDTQGMELCELINEEIILRMIFIWNIRILLHGSTYS